MALAEISYSSDTEFKSTAFTGAAARNKSKTPRKEPSLMLLLLFVVALVVFKYVVSMLLVL